MTKEIPGKIYLADQRGLFETGQYRSYRTFNCGDYQQEHKEPFGSLRVFNEEMLAGNATIERAVESDSYILLLPITGALRYQNAAGSIFTVEVGEMGVSYFPARSVFMVANPYEQEVISFLQIQIKAEPIKEFSAPLFRFDLEKASNILIPIASDLPETTPDLPFSVGIGQFDGRQETVYSLKSKKTQFFAFVISGAFELEGRLLHEKDGLALWDTADVELEALSNNALVLVLELL